MNKLLLIITILSLSLNLYQFLTPSNEIILQKNNHKTSLLTRKTHEKKSILKTNNIKEDESTTIAGNDSSQQKGTEDHGDKKADESDNYDQVSENTKNDIETFIIRDLSFNMSETSEVFNIINKSDKEFNDHIVVKRKKLEGLYNESYGYTYDPEDYILMGKKKLEARALIKQLIGANKYKKLMIYIRDYNHGKHAESFVPIEI